MRQCERKFLDDDHNGSGFTTTQQSLVQASITSFGESVDGEIYACNGINGDIYHVISACGVVTDVSVTNVTSTTATISWTPSGATTYRVVYKTQTGPKNLVTTSGSSVNLTGLTPSTHYMFRVQNKCTGSSATYSTAAHSIRCRLNWL
jgi:hypothetical protein